MITLKKTTHFKNDLDLSGRSRSFNHVCQRLRERSLSSRLLWIRLFPQHSIYYTQQWRMDTFIDWAWLSEGGEDSRGPEDLAAQRGYEEEAAHPLAEALLQGVQHGDVALLAHPVSEEDAAWWWQRERESSWYVICSNSNYCSNYYIHYTVQSYVL